ncbi:MEKHLA domain-containing protein [Bremerella sp. P1]|uniref:MEKHLA domain-containing protein n=1 Tax=Bremerella sp. P1 TaxID=3026424 RepID=UPI0023676E27|nr:MEKHLA domain-containing protein [Bremerella sp. P1]WDI42917.1 MEKHLA domain-containing protein [Bremerella sp. P1]
MPQDHPALQPWQEHGWPDHLQILLDSYYQLLGEQLVPRSGSAEEDARRVFEAPFVVVSHTAASDPILNFGNQTALGLWEIDIETLMQTPSRMTAEPMHRDERAQLLERTTRDGYVDDYQGIRIATTGRRFRIEQAIVWNLTNAAGDYVGQAATFDQWTFLDA